MEVTKKNITTISISTEDRDKGRFLASEMLGTTTLSSIVSFLIKREYKKLTK